jgi:hypothetical protein
LSLPDECLSLNLPDGCLSLSVPDEETFIRYAQR